MVGSATHFGEWGVLRVGRLSSPLAGSVGVNYCGLVANPSTSCSSRGGRGGGGHETPYAPPRCVWGQWWGLYPWGSGVWVQSRGWLPKERCLVQ